MTSRPLSSGKNERDLRPLGAGAQARQRERRGPHAVALVPLGILIIKHSKYRHEVECKRREQDRERELQIITVITSNTEAIAGLRSTLVQIHSRIEENTRTLKTIQKKVKRKVA